MSNDAYDQHGDVDRGENSSAASSAPQAKARMRRAARKRTRTEPPQLQFVVATDPSQFRDETIKRSVRSQAMIQYRYKADRQRPKEKGSSSKASNAAAEPSVEATPPLAGPPVRASNIEHRHDRQLYPSTSAAWRALNPNASPKDSVVSDSPPLSNYQIPQPSTRYLTALSFVLHHHAMAKVTEYEESDVHEASMMSMVIGALSRMSFAQLGDGVDPFLVFPQFASSELSSMSLVRECLRAFVSPATLEKWLPSMLSHPHLLLSATTLGSCWLDMHAGCSGDTKRTVLVKGEVIGWINQRLRDGAQQFEDSTLMVILHLLVGEMWSCNEKTLRIHESGIARLIAHRGGMEQLGGNGAMAEVAASCCLHADVLCEAIPFPLFQRWKPSRFRKPADAEAIPESPIFCPRAEFFTLARDPFCSSITYDLLCDMRELTALFLTHHEPAATGYNAEADEYVASSPPSSRQYDAKICGICERLATLPSAHMPGLPTSDDWVYESCRIASIIYASAILMRVPLSVAAEPGRSVILTDSYPSGPKRTPGPRHLAEELYEALERSNTDQIWGDMSGVLYWVSLVGAAAARTPLSLDMSMRPSRPRSETYAVWVRRCLIMFATRAMIILIFQHPLPIVMAQKRMLKVQELLRMGGSSVYS